MASSRKHGGRIGRVGWLFADLSIILMILFAATAVRTTGTDCPPGTDEAEGCPTTTTTTTTTIPTPTTTTTPGGGGGVKPEPLKISLRDVNEMSASRLRETLDKQVQSTDLGESVFGVIIIYGGSRGIDSSEGDGDKPAWSGVNPTTSFETGHDNQLPYGDVTLKLFPLIR